MKRLVALSVVVAALVFAGPASSQAGASTDAALALGSFAVFNQLMRGETVLHDLGGGRRAVVRETVVVQQPPAVVYAPAPPPTVVYVPAPPPVIYAPPPTVVYATPPAVIYGGAPVVYPLGHPRFIPPKHLKKLYRVHR